MKFLLGSEELFSSDTSVDVGDVVILDEQYYTVSLIATDYNTVKKYDSSRVGHKVAILQIMD